jgi:hypothetical protein
MSEQFCWSDATVIEFINYQFGGNWFVDMPSNMAKFKESKQPKPEYEITKVKRRGSGINVVGSKYTLQDGDEIYQVKRLSDDLLVTLNDLIGHRLGDATLVVDRFEINSKGICAIDKEDKLKYFLLKNWKKIIPILFTTQDGKDIYEGMEYWFVGSQWQAKWGNAEIGTGQVPHFKYFSTKEKAEEYVLMNKPLFTTKEVIDISSKITSTGKSITQMAKGKIKLTDSQ